MTKSIRRILNLPFYPWLVGIYPILHLYSENLGLVFDHEVVTVVILMLAATSIAFPAANLWFKDRHKTALILGVCSMFFSVSGHVHDLAFATIPLDSWTEIVVIVAGVTLYLLHKRGSTASYERITATANLLSLALLIWPVAAIGSDQLAGHEIDYGSYSEAFPNTSEQLVSKIKDSKTHPDIYYIIPDGYPSDRWSQESMNYDNSEFSEALRDRGFVIADDAQCNYAITLLSLASTLNMQYYNSNPSGLADLDYLRLSIAESEVAHQLMQRGYTYIVLMSGTLFPSSIADVNRDFGPSGPIEVEIVSRNSVAKTLANSAEDQEQLRYNELIKRSFVALYLETTLLRIVANQLNVAIADYDAAYDWFAAQRFLDTIPEIEAISTMPEATFTVAHLLKPHRPVVFNESGDIIPDVAYPGRTEYVPELKFINRRLLQMIDTILENSQSEPVIIFQADHGSKFGSVRTDDKRLIHFDTYSAIHVPEPFSIEIPQPFTLINTFPLVFNAVFDTDYALREDYLFEVLIGYEEAFLHNDVTDIFGH